MNKIVHTKLPLYAKVVLNRFLEFNKYMVLFWCSLTFSGSTKLKNIPMISKTKYAVATNEWNEDLMCDLIA